MPDTTSRSGDHPEDPSRARLDDSPHILARGSWPEIGRIAELLRTETIGGVLLLLATVVAMGWANSGWSSEYTSVVSKAVGPSFLHLHLTTSAWAGDGLLAIFFFVAGLELKQEFVAGDLRDPRRAAVPVVAAVGGVIVPTLIYLAVTVGRGGADGWAIPTATDIAFALAVLAMIGTHLPAALRTFLLTLAVVDDLLAIIIIAFFYTEHLVVGYLLLAAVPLAAFGVLVQRRVSAWWVLIPLAVMTWALVHASGVHATVAGVLLAFTVPVAGLASAPGTPGPRGPGMAESFEHAWRPVSTGFAVPVFALVSAGVTIGGTSALGSALTDRVAVGVMLGLIVGKTIGVFGSTYLVARFTHAELDSDVAWIDVFGLAVLSGIGFTVSLLISELAFEESSTVLDHAKIAVLVGSVGAALGATVVLRLRNRWYRRVCETEAAAAAQESFRITG